VYSCAAGVVPFKIQCEFPSGGDDSNQNVGLSILKVHTDLVEEVFSRELLSAGHIVSMRKLSQTFCVLTPFKLLKKNMNREDAVTVASALIFDGPNDSVGFQPRGSLTDVTDTFGERALLCVQVEIATSSHKPGSMKLVDRLSNTKEEVQV
jgi:hypothetical protein